MGLVAGGCFERWLLTPRTHMTSQGHPFRERPTSCSWSRQQLPEPAPIGVFEGVVSAAYPPSQRLLRSVAFLVRHNNGWS